MRGRIRRASRSSSAPRAKCGASVAQRTMSAALMISSRFPNSATVPEHLAATSAARDCVLLTTVIEVTAASFNCSAARSRILPASRSTALRPERSSKIFSASSTAAELALTVDSPIPVVERTFLAAVKA